MKSYAKLNRTKFTSTRLHSDEPVTIPDLAVTPSQMYDLVQRGIPVTPANLGMSYDEGVDDLEYTPSLDNSRYPDINTMWEHSHELKDKAKKYFQDNKSKLV